MSKQLKEYRILFEKLDSEHKPNNVEEDNLGLRSKLGGKPGWIQDSKSPLCPHCNKQMTFVMQLDSIEHQATNNPHSINALSDEQEYMFGDVGMLYTFFCFECSEVQSIFQGY